MGLLLIPDRWENQNPNTVLKERVWNILLAPMKMESLFLKFKL